MMTALRSFLRPIRLGAAMALVCALCLPLSRCSQGGNTNPPPSKQTLITQFFPQTNKNFTYEYAIGELGFTVKGLCTLLAFTWPLLSVLAAGKLAESRFGWILHLLEVPLCAGTGYMLFGLTYWAEWLYGGYIAGISICLFLLTALAFLLYSLWRLCRKWWGKIRGPGHPRQLIGDPAPSV